MAYKDETFNTFSDKVFSSAPVPGGGAVAPLAAALGAALDGMVLSITLGKSTYLDIRPEIEELSARCSVLKEEFFALADADSEGFLPMLDIYRLPKEAPGREAALENALLGACAAPRKVLELCLEGLELTEEVFKKASRSAVSDIAAAALLLKSAASVSELNILANTRSLSDRALSDRMAAECTELARKCSLKADAVYENTKAFFLPEEN